MLHVFNKTDKAALHQAGIVFFCILFNALYVDCMLCKMSRSLIQDSHEVSLDEMMITWCNKSVNPMKWRGQKVWRHRTKPQTAAVILIWFTACSSNSWRSCATKKNPQQWYKNKISFFRYNQHLNLLPIFWMVMFSQDLAWVLIPLRF